MSTPSNTGTSTTTAIRHSEQYQSFKRYASITFIVAAPILIALPPRKLDFYTVSLTSAFLFSANYLTLDQTGKSIMDRLGSRIGGHQTPSIFKDLPTERAEQVREQLRRARDAAREQEVRMLQQQQQHPQEMGVQLGQQSHGNSETEAGAAGITDLGKKIWMGGESEGWREKRMEEERKALEEGRGYGDLIMDHIREAIGMDNKKGGSDGDQKS